MYQQAVLYCMHTRNIELLISSSPSKNSRAVVSKSLIYNNGAERVVCIAPE